VGSIVTQDETIGSDWTKLMELTLDVLLAAITNINMISKRPTNASLI
jgi:hypothetical protein